VPHVKDSGRDAAIPMRARAAAAAGASTPAAGADVPKADDPPCPLDGANQGHLEACPFRDVAVHC
jgi:hypothetical protein